LVLAPAAWIAFAASKGVKRESDWLELLAGVALLVASLLWIALRWRWRRARLLREVFFEGRRKDYARKLGLPAESLAVYPPLDGDSSGSSLLLE
jgi:hypothetical protein